MTSYSFIHQLFTEFIICSTALYLEFNFFLKMQVFRHSQGQNGMNSLYTTWRKMLWPGSPGILKLAEILLKNVLEALLRKFRWLIQLRNCPISANHHRCVVLHSSCVHSYSSE